MLTEQTVTSTLTSSTKWHQVTRSIIYHVPRMCAIDVRIKWIIEVHEALDHPIGNHKWARVVWSGRSAF